MDFLILPSPLLPVDAYREVADALRAGIAPATVVRDLLRDPAVAAHAAG